MEIISLNYEGLERSDDDLRRLNFFVRAAGAWRASALPHWEAHDILCDVLAGEFWRIAGRGSVGGAGGGRWTPRAPLLPFIRDKA